MSEIEIEYLKTAFIRINDQHYVADLDYFDFKKGDIVLDKKDFTHGTVVEIRDGFAAVGEGIAVELGVELSRLIKLKSVLSEKIIQINSKTGIFELEN